MKIGKLRVDLVGSEEMNVLGEEGKRKKP